ncbi:hypothetical protein M5K25_001505 [Dendrobium thyrsiflorum]|uniref:Uncharacterized protein n=1 Tax=Dendrobium thyrsiflorum TaxID=117978 RepID=A0ABD0VY33_DENTH
MPLPLSFVGENEIYKLTMGPRSSPQTSAIRILFRFDFSVSCSRGAAIAIERIELPCPSKSSIL